jgi:hypothetical protein
MATQKDKKTFQQRTVEGIKGGVEETSGSRLLDLMAVIQEIALKRGSLLSLMQ